MSKRGADAAKCCLGLWVSFGVWGHVLVVLFELHWILGKDPPVVLLKKKKVGV